MAAGLPPAISHKPSTAARPPVRLSAAWMLPLTPPCTLGEAAWVVSDCAAPPLVGLGTARWLCHDVITASLQPYGCASSGVIGNVAASLLTFSIPREFQRVHKVYQLKRDTTPDPSPYVAICVWVFFGQQRGLHPRPATVEFIPFSFWYDAPLTSQYSDRRHAP